MKAIGIICVAAALTLAMPATASTVFRCKTPGGKVYYSDKGCKSGDAYAESSGKGSMSVFQGKEMSGTAPRASTSAPGRPASRPAPAASNDNTAKSPFIRRAEKVNQ